MHQLSTIITPQCQWLVQYTAAVAALREVSQVTSCVGDTVINLLDCGSVETSKPFASV